MLLQLKAMYPSAGFVVFLEHRPSLLPKVSVSETHLCGAWHVLPVKGLRECIVWRSRLVVR